MVDRILIAPGELEISRPGVDVKSAGLSQLLFSAAHGSPARFIRGSFSSSVNGPGDDSRTIFFGKTFTSPPLVLTQWFEGTGASRPGNWVPQRGLNGQRRPYSDFAFSFTRIDVDVYTDRMFLQMTSASSDFDYAVDYLVFDYRIGF